MVEESSTEPAVFIIESVAWDEEESGLREGEILKRILQLAAIPSDYWYIRTKAELRAILERFGGSRKRYLHISRHGSQSALYTTLDRVPFSKFAELARPFLDGKRLFLSACEVTNKRLAAAILPASGCYSVIGPEGEVTFADAAIMWASFYHLMFRERRKGMRRMEIKQVLQVTSTAFGVPMRYFGLTNQEPRFSELLVKPAMVRGKTSSRPVQMRFSGNLA